MKLIFISGPSGSGKTTISNQIIAITSVNLFRSDIQELYGGDGKYGFNLSIPKEEVSYKYAFPIPFFLPNLLRNSIIHNVDWLKPY